MHTKALSDIIDPWLESLVLPGGALHSWKPSDKIYRGNSHWYTCVRSNGEIGPEDWILTVRGSHVEVRDGNENGPTAISWHVIDAADPEFFPKLERDLKAVLEYLARS